VPPAPESGVSVLWKPVVGLMSAFAPPPAPSLSVAQYVSEQPMPSVEQGVFWQLPQVSSLTAQKPCFRKLCPSISKRPFFRR
jgi:hypothetical protein